MGDGIGENSVRDRTVRVVVVARGSSRVGGWYGRRLKLVMTKAFCFSTIFFFFFTLNVIYSRNPVMENLGIKAKGKKTRNGKNFAEF